MAQPRPITLTSLGDAYNKSMSNQTLSPINLMGIVIDLLAPTTNWKTGDSQITFTLQDSDMMKIPVLAKGLKARLFTSSQEEPPPTPSVGDIVLMRNCKVAIMNPVSNILNTVQVSNFRGVPTITGIKRVTSTVVYQAASIPEPAFKQSFLGEKDIPCLPQDPSPKPSKAEQMYAIHLKQLTPSVINVASASDATAIPTGPAAGPSHSMSVPNRLAAGKASGLLQTNSKFRLIQAVTFNDYCDLAVEVIKKFPNPNGNMELYVTDYTPNDALYDYPAPDDADAEDEFGRYDKINLHEIFEHDHDSNRDGDYYAYISNVTGKRKNWPGPSGRHTLQVELLSPHAGFARDNVREGDFVKLSNVRIKQSNAGKMEGNLWPDKRFPDKILIHSLNDEKQRKTLFNRRESYWQGHNNRIATNKRDKDTKTQERRLAKKQRKRENRALRSAQNTGDPSAVVNKHVSCMNYEGFRLSTLKDIQSRDHSYTGRSGVEQELPYLNVKNKVRVRVADFWPPILEDFASLVSSTDASGEDSENDTNMNSPFASQKWQWDFFLLLEDLKSHRPGCAPEQLWVHVDHRYAEFLLCMDQDATDLRRDSQTLAKLREQMAILWGNLEEIKVAALAKQQPFPPHESAPTDTMGLSNLAFDCCVSEYGQALDGDDIDSGKPSSYTKLYDMSGARIFE
ncbi:hypothetical protein E4T49_07993 [Aureobasidium sp. EXF-10728]|nr:hypothetical protein E4T49_07993 [Aureobasidium sp. EXF-10728]